ncbi:MinD/ParA family protein [Nitratiruptor sp. YY09-18]|uniref:MinD/ParA family protein n=1 Tax=Nitratiruptor sp. YY09-18 TaxID=2724901 RepID=UPI0019150D4C|nr:MinD/ParA family protein [Nitratiruptor sp. YY09-18]
MMDQASGLRDLVAQKSTGNSKFIAIASGKGGVGKTNFAVNFSYLMANEFKKKILLIDADIGMANVHLFLNRKAKKGIKDLFSGEKIDDVITKVYGFDILMGFSGIDDLFDLDDISIQSIINQLNEISNRYDFVIIDTGAGIDEKVSAFLRASNKSYIITTPEPTAMMDAYALMKSIYNIFGYDKFKVIVNMCRSEQEGENTYNKLKVSCKKFLGIEIELLGTLPFTNNLRQSVRAQKLITMEYPKDSYTQNLRKICQQELSLQEPLEENFWKKLFTLMGKS